MLAKDSKIALFMTGALDKPYGKMGFGMLRYSQQEIVCAIDPDYAGKTTEEVTNIPRHCPVVATVDEAAALGADVLVIGIAPPGGQIPPEYVAEIDRAWNLGLSIVNGLHQVLGPTYNVPTRDGQYVWDVRVEPPGLTTSTGAAATLKAKRVLTVGSDMAVGKMTSGLELQKAALKMGLNCAFVATGQIGICITGSGVPLDGIRVDFACGAIERECLKYADADLIIIEGQGSLVHPSSTSPLPLLRGSMPTHLLFCHRAGQEGLLRFPEIRIPPIKQLTTLFEDLGSCCGTYSKPRTAGVALNCGHLSEEEGVEAVARFATETGFLTLDPVRMDMSPMVKRIMGGV